MKKHRYFDSSGNEVDERIALDRNVLRSGFSMRIPAQFRDTAMSRHPLITDGRTGNPLALHKPGVL